MKVAVVRIRTRASASTTEQAPAGEAGSSHRCRMSL
jgi:hypothetical protein